MGMASDMKQLTIDLAKSHEDRAKAVDRITQDTEQITGEARGLIEGFGSSRKQTSREMRKGLNRDKANLSTEVKTLRGKAQGLVKGFRASRRQDSSRLRKDLYQATNDRRAEVGATLRDAHNNLTNFKAQRKRDSTKLRESLARSRSQNQASVAHLVGGAQSFVGLLANNRKGSAKKLRTDLAKGKKDRENQVKETQSQLRRSRMHLRGDLQEAQAAWRELAGASGANKAAPKARPNGKKAAIPGNKLPDLEIKMLDAISARAGGTTLTEIASSLGVVPIVLGRVSRSLVQSGKVRKEDKLYFPGAV